MIVSNRTIAILAFGAILWTAASTQAGAANEQQAAEFFESTNMVTFRVKLEDFEVSQLAQRPRTYVRGSVQVDDRVWDNVGIRLKGSGTFQPISEHPSLTLKFNWKEPHQRFSGLAKLFLENSAQDASRMCKFVANAAFTDGGIPAPRITQAHVFLNDRDLGACVVAEAINKDFLKRHFGNASGNMYEAFFSDVGRGLKQDNGPPGDQSDLRELGAAAAIKDETQRKQKLSQLLDVDEFLNFLAIETILANWDGYAYHQNNYRLYHDPTSSRIKIIPHDLDNTFSEAGISLMPPRNGILTAALLATQRDRDDFRERVARFFPRVLDAQHIQKRVQACVVRLSEGATPEQRSAIERQAALLEHLVQERWRHFGQELAGSRPPTPNFDSGGMAHLSGWSAKTDWNGAAVNAVVDDQKPALCIEAAGSYCFGSWRLPVWLPAGRYRIEGEAKTRGVIGLPSQTGSGAGVRVLGGRRGSGIQGNCNHWAEIRHDFVVQEGCEWVELIAELRASGGTAWFDPETLRLIRVR